MYTWYVNLAGDVQIYEGNALGHNKVDAYSEQQAKTCHIIETPHYKHVVRQKYSGLKGIFNRESTSLFEVTHTTKEYLTPIKYWIPSEQAQMFFMCIGEYPNQLWCAEGITNIDVSEFLD